MKPPNPTDATVRPAAVIARRLTAALIARGQTDTTSGDSVVGMKAGQRSNTLSHGARGVKGAVRAAADLIVS